MAKPFRCWFRFHKWVKIRNPDGRYYRRCARCGEDKMGDYEGPIVEAGGGSGSV